MRGKKGPLLIEDYRTVLPLTHRFVESAQQAGFPFTPDLSGAQMEGVGYSQMSRNGRFRGSTARTFLAEARNRPNLEVVTNALAAKLLFNGKRCTGVAILQNGQQRDVYANREVIVSSGTINSPHLLQVSGIGPGAHLKSIGVHVVHDLPGVGGNLSDHYAVRVSMRVRNAVSINQLSRRPRLLKEIANWMTIGKGALTFGVSSAQCFCRSREGLASPDIQLLFSPASYDENKFGTLEKKPGVTIAVSIARPESRGTIMAKSSDPRDRPAIRPNYLSAPGDLRVSMAGIRHARKIFAQPAFAANRRRGDHAGHACCGRCGDRELHPECRHDHLSPGWHLQDGRGSDGRGGLAAARAWHDGTARDRRVHHAGRDDGQHERADDHDRREGGVDDPRGRAGGLEIIDAQVDRGAEYHKHCCPRRWRDRALCGSAPISRGLSSPVRRTLRIDREV